jgi:hypothetical protein
MCSDKIHKLAPMSSRWVVNYHIMRRLEALKWLREHDCPWGVRTCAYPLWAGSWSAEVGAGARLSVRG